MPISNERSPAIWPEDPEERTAAAMAEAQSALLIPEHLTTYTNDVYVQRPVEGHVIKVPMAEVTHSDAVGLLYREVGALELVNNGAAEAGVKFPVEIPRVLAYSGPLSRYDWAAFSYVHGEVLDRTYIWDHFSTSDYQSLGRKGGALTFAVSRAVKPAAFREVLESYDPCVVDREAQLRSVLGKLGMYEEMGYVQLAALLRRCGQEYGKLQSEREATPPIFIHDDLHPGNLVQIPTQRPSTQEQWELIGVIDWAFAKLGSAARDFRHLAILHPEALQAALETWHDLTRDSQGKSIPISEREVWLWADIQSAISCIVCIDSFGTVVPYALESMRRIHPEVDWEAEFSAATSNAKPAEGNGT